MKARGDDTDSEVRLSGLFVYPIKSAAGISVSSWRVDPRGLEGDRRWMLVDESGTFLSQRKVARLALVRPEPRGDRLVVSAPGAASIEMPLRGDGGATTTVRIWRDDCVAREADAAVSDWFASVLQVACRAVWLPDEAKRRVSRRYGSAQVSFADAFPFLLMAEESLGDLNSRLGEPVPMDRFRPNLVVSGAAPYAEDTWRSIVVGGLRFTVTKPCARCVITTIDQSTAAVGREPLATLAGYRSRDGKVMFGQNLVHLDCGELTVGASVTVRSN